MDISNLNWIYTLRENIHSDKSQSSSNSMTNGENVQESIKNSDSELKSLSVNFLQSANSEKS